MLLAISELSDGALRSLSLRSHRSPLPRVATISADDVGGAGSEPSPPAFPHFRSRLSHARRTRWRFYSFGLENFPSRIPLKRGSRIQGHLRTKEKPLEMEPWRSAD